MTNEVLGGEESKLKIISDEVVNLYNKRHERIDCNLRLIKTKNKDNLELWFLTNITYLDAIDIAMSYKRRWDIEVFFKFVKQNLQLKNFISYNNNGMRVYIYCILIAAILFIIFKITNKYKGYKIALLTFTLAIEKEIIKDIVLFCGGNPDLVEQKL